MKINVVKKEMIYDNTVVFFLQYNNNEKDFFSKLFIFKDFHGYFFDTETTIEFGFCEPSFTFPINIFREIFKKEYGL